MTLITEQDRTAIRKLADAMSKDVSITLYTQRRSPLIVPGVVPCETCEVTEQLMRELADLLPHVRVTVRDLVADGDEAAGDGVDRVPTVLFSDAGNRVRFVGLPSGYEFPALLQSVLELGGAESNLSQGTRAKLALVEKPVDLKVFVTPT